MAKEKAVILEEDECYCKICGALTKQHFRRDLSVRRIVWLCPDCWNKTLYWTDKELRRYLRNNKIGVTDE